MNRKRTLIIILLTFFVIILLGVLLTYIVYVNRTKEPVDILSDYLINITSLVIAFIALIIALITYFSIDSVNSVTAMEGSVLENPNYTIAYSEMVMSFIDCKNQNDFKKLLIDKVYNGLKRPTATCIQFADCIQIMIDHIIWFAYVDFNDNDFKTKCDKLIIKLEKELLRYNSLSNGIQYILNENIKLIKYIMDYQQGRNLNKSNICNLEDIRGKMIQNPISQIVYYDYLGLDYRKKANQILKKCGSDDVEFTVEYMKSVMEYEYSQDDIQHVKMLLRRAQDSFNNASKLSDTDILWQGYIKYNVARTCVMEHLLDSTNGAEILEYINEVISIRESVCFLYQYGGDSYLNSRFNVEYRNAVNLLLEFKKLLGSY